MPTKDLLEAWFAFGEDAEIVDLPDGAWRSANELGDFADRPAGEEERDWRSLDPRAALDDDDEGDDNTE